MPIHTVLLLFAALWNGAGQTTELARRLVLDRIEAIAAADHCRGSFARERIDLERVRMTARLVRFYNAQGPEGGLRFSEVVGKPASPDQSLRELARELSADAFVLGYQDGGKYVRTKQVVLNRGYFAEGDLRDGTWRLRPEEEKQALLLHEVLHVALDQDDDYLTRRELCPLKLLAFCRRDGSEREVQ